VSLTLQFYTWNFLWMATTDDAIPLS